MNYGNLLVYIGLISGAIAFLGFLYEGIKKQNIQRYISWAIVVFAVSLSLSYLLLLYYFYSGDFRFMYVWSFTSKYYPVYYRLAGSLAGQQGTLLFWAALIAVGSLWMAKTKGSETEFIRKTQILVILLGIFFAFLTIKDSPFKTIYDVQPDLPNDFVPEDGNGLNPLLLDPWMATHPFTTFMGYAGTTIPMAGAIVYLLITLRGSKKEDEELAHRMWVNKGIQWLRISWLFSTISMIFGANWAYRTLGWGGFWAWDPIENAMLIPWLILTAAMHVAVEHKRDKTQYSILAPVLVSFAFTFVVYATMVTRSGVFESVHAFIAGAAGPYIIGLTLASFFVPLILGTIKYLSTESIEREEKGILTRTNLFYAAILILLIITFITVYGTTYPPIVKLITTKKYSVTRQFYNIWLYPFFLIMLLLVGLGLHYKPSMKKENIKVFSVFSGITLIAALVKPTQFFNIVEYSEIISANVPKLYGIIAGISGLSVIPPAIYILYAAEERYKMTFLKLKDGYAKMREAGILLIHIGIAVVSIGIVFSSILTTEFSVTLNKNDVGKMNMLSPAIFHEGLGKLGTWGGHESTGEESPYSVQLLGYKEYVEYGALDGNRKEEKVQSSMSLTDFYNSLQTEKLKDSYTVRGKVEDVIKGEHVNYLRLTGDNSELWVATDTSWGEVPKGIDFVVTGTVLFNINSAALNRTLNVVIFAARGEQFKDVDMAQVYRKVQKVDLAVYEGTSKKIGEGAAKVEFYKTGDARRPMIDRSVLPDGKDVYVIFDGVRGDELPVTVRIKPFMNWMWAGTIFFIIGIILTIVSNKEVGEKANEESEKAEALLNEQ